MRQLLYLKGAKHRIENLFKKPVKIMEVQTGANFERNRYC